MKHSTLTRAILFSVFFVGCADESNPTRDQLVQSNFAPFTGPKESDVKAGGSQVVVVDPNQQNQPAPTSSIPAQALTGVSLICSNSSRPELAAYQEDMAVICVNGQATKTLSDALAKPYKGTGDPSLSIVRASDAQGVSDFIVLAVIEIPKPITEVFAKTPNLSRGTLNPTATDVRVRVTKSIVSPAGTDLLVTADVRVLMEISVVDKEAILQYDMHSFDSQKNVMAMLGRLKPGLAGNDDHMLFNSLSFMIGEGATKTTLISVNHTKTTNRNRPEIAKDAMLGVALETVLDAYRKLNL